MTMHRPTRREFLRLGGLGLGCLVLKPPCLRAAEPLRRELSFLVISDTHLGYRDQDHAARQWEKTAAELRGAAGDLVVHLGDVVDGGREPQYAVYRRTRETIGKPVHEIPGNHDPAALFGKYLRDPIDTTVDHHWLRFVLLNNSLTDSHDGFLSAGQLDWIAAQCRQAKQEDKYLAICMHVPSHTNRHPDRGWYVKPENGQKELYEIVTDHQDRVLCLMHGHFHNGLRGWDDHAPVHEIAFPSALYNQDRRLESQKAPGYNPAQFRPGYTQVTIKDETMRLRYRPTGTESDVTRKNRLAQMGRANE